MDETDYKQDFIVTWVSGGETIQEGFTLDGLNKFDGVTYHAKILQCYKEFNAGLPLEERRFITLIEAVSREILWEKEILKDDDDA